LPERGFEESITYGTALRREKKISKRYANYWPNSNSRKILYSKEEEI